MASNYASVKLSGDFVDQARREAEVVHRSVGAQVEYWARLGRAVENTPGFGIDKVRQALDRQLKLEAGTAAERDQAFAALSAEFDAPSAATRAHYAALGAREGDVGRDGKGRLVRRIASGCMKQVG
jgi:hypothetical protein